MASPAAGVGWSPPIPRRRFGLALALETAAARRGRAGEALLVRRSDDRSPCWMKLAPGGGTDTGVALVVIEDPERNDDTTGQTAQRIFGLSRAEDELAFPRRRR